MGSENYAPFILMFFTTTTLLIFWKYLKYHFRYWERRRIPHIPPTIPKGNMQEWLRTKHSAQIFSETYEKYRNRGFLFAGFYFNTQKALITLDLELVRNVLVQNSHYFLSRGLFHNERDDPLTGNLFLLDGPKWSSLRSKLMPTLAWTKIKCMFTLVLSVGDELQEAFSNKIEATVDGVFDVTFVLSRFACDVIGNCVYGVNCQSMMDPNIPFSIMTRKFFSERKHSAIVDSLINCFPDWARFLRMKIIPQDVTDFFIETVKETIKYREENNINRPDYIDVLMKLSNKPGSDGQPLLTKEELAAQAFVFFITAFDTCSSTVSCALYELAQHPDIQNKLRQEIYKGLKSHKQKLTYESLKKIKYLDQVISETLRKYPAFPTLFRKCTERFVPLKRPHFYIEKGCMVIIPVLSIHYDPNYFPNPHDFDPDRFSTANISKIKPSSYLPFGDGERSCIGMHFGRMQTNLALLKLISNFKFEICSKTKVPLKLAVPTFNLNPTSVTLKVAKL